MLAGGATVVRVVACRQPGWLAVGAGRWAVGCRLQVVRWLVQWWCAALRWLVTGDWRKPRIGRNDHHLLLHPRLTTGSGDKMAAVSVPLLACEDHC